MKTALLVAVFLIILGVVAGVAYYLITPTTMTTQTSITSATLSTPTPTTISTTASTTSIPPTTPTTTPTSYIQPRITDVTSEGFVYVEEEREIYWRFKISGEVDLRDKIEINGIYGWWFGRINVTLPNEEDTRVHEPPDYTNIVTSFRYLSGSKIFDAYVLDVDAWWEKSFLDGTYRIVVWLKGPYENRSVLLDKNFVFRMAFNASITPTAWTSWDENLRLTITNTGDVPLFLQGVGIERSGTGTVIGQVLTPEEIIMSGETREIVAPVQIFGDFKEEFKGKNITLDFLLSFAGARQIYKVTLNVRFPTG